MWDDLVRGAIGAVVLADTRRLKDCFPALDYFESCGLPYVVAVDRFDGSERFDADDVREALTVPPHIPVMIMDARRGSRSSRPCSRWWGTRSTRAPNKTYTELGRACGRYSSSEPVSPNSACPRPPVARVRGHPDVEPDGGRDPHRPRHVDAVHVPHGTPARARSPAELLGVPGPEDRRTRRLGRRPRLARPRSDTSGRWTGWAGSTATRSRSTSG